MWTGLAYIEFRGRLPLISSWPTQSPESISGAARCVSALLSLRILKEGCASVFEHYANVSGVWYTQQIMNTEWMFRMIELASLEPQILCSFRISPTFKTAIPRELNIKLSNAIVRGQFMTSERPLLQSPPLEEDFSTLPQTSVGSHSFCICSAASFSFTLVANHHISVGDKDSQVYRGESNRTTTTEQFHSADSHCFEQFMLECPPQEGKHLVSWGTMELQGIQSSLEIAVSTDDQEKENKRHRVLQKSVQFDELLSADKVPRLIHINDPRKTNDKYEFTGNEIRTTSTFGCFGRTVSLPHFYLYSRVTAIKDGYEDWRRHRSDRNENNREAHVLQFGQFKMKKWKNICAGEVVKIYCDDTIPCDMVLLGTSDPNGIAYIQTMNLDAEFLTLPSMHSTSNALLGVMEVEKCGKAIKKLGVTGQRRWKLKSAIDVDPDNTVIPIASNCSSFSSSNLACDGEEFIEYQGESPDEQALVVAASAYGYTLLERTSGHIVIGINGEMLRLDVLGLHEFDSVRKRMSVVIRFPNNSVKVLAKGADTSMLSIIDNHIEDGATENEYSRLRHETEDHLIDYSSVGLRTLVIASRELSGAELEEWQEKYEEASISLSERATKLRQAASLVECHLNLLGATGVEDKLQEGVPETIESLRQAGIKVWVLTGDKQETAISIALSCRLLTCEMEQIIINGTSEDECRRLLADAKTRYRINPLISGKGSGKLKGNNGFRESTEKLVGSEVLPLALIIDGNSLVYILEKDLEPDLFDLATSCRVVLCCRVAPLQKAGIVDLIKSRTNDMTLAIGDGANDVSMIQMADVGVGICGQEGRQAVMASDFAMGQFRFLKRLLLVHGHWNYQRVGYLVLYNFYRNAVFVLMLFWYILFTAFSTTSALTDWSSVFYSVIYTSVPTIVVGILDKDLSHKTLLLYPKLYCAGHRQESYNLQLFWITILDTLWQSLVLFYIPFLTYMESTIDIWSLGGLWTIAVVFLVNIHLAMDIQRWVLITHLAIWGSIAVTYLCMVALDSIPFFPNYWTIYHLMGSRTYWLSVLLITVLALLPRFICKVIWQMFWPSDVQIAKEAEILRKFPNTLGSKPEQGVS
ncbi:hypothetical protein HPP92_013802 [Vanilla planifolia]|uniref:Phospholipid-transporting ATPase n=1 Tax=Vanilla planifolia TaxID=51239 RepID=A0A835QW89_VANPL|nr:hypothetical protein HPP92_013802 [Vanilla planifolia]